MTHGSLFSGIGGFDLAAQWMDWQILFHCELNPFGQKVLKYYWPDAELFTDITKTDFTKYANRIDILSGGFPCQPFSVAGERKGTADSRHLWPEMLRAIRGIAPRWVVGENVRGLVSWSGGLVFDQVCIDLEALGYEVFPGIIPAASVNAPHKRERIWFIAHCNNSGNVSTSNTDNEGCQRDRTFPLSEEQEPSSGRYWECLRDNAWQNFPTQSPVCRRNDGIPPELAGITFSKHRNESIKAYGNAVVPQVVYQIFKAIQDYENLHQL